MAGDENLVRGLGGRRGMGRGTKVSYKRVSQFQ